jgi:putative acetyltransferase
VRVRDEEPRDRAAVHELTVSAFGREAEAHLVDTLRAEARPLVSLVAEEDATIVGHVLFTPVALAGFAGNMMGLGPLAVLPARQRRGVGTALVRAGLARCRADGVAAVVVLGHPGYYPRFGFAPAATFGIASEYDAGDSFMAVEIVSGALRGARGVVRYHSAFGKAL